MAWASARGMRTSARLLWLCSCLYDVPVVLDLHKVREVSEVVRRAGGTRSKPGSLWSARICLCAKAARWPASFIFPRRSSPIRRNLFRAERQIVLGKKSGLDSIDLKCKELGVAITVEQRGPVLAAVKQAAVRAAAAGKPGLVSDANFRRILAGMHIV